MKISECVDTGREEKLETNTAAGNCSRRAGTPSTCKLFADGRTRSGNSGEEQGITITRTACVSDKVLQPPRIRPVIQQTREGRYALQVMFETP